MKNLGSGASRRASVELPFLTPKIMKRCNNGIETPLHRALLKKEKAETNARFALEFCFLSGADHNKCDPAALGFRYKSHSPWKERPKGSSQHDFPLFPLTFSLFFYKFMPIHLAIFPPTSLSNTPAVYLAVGRNAISLIISVPVRDL